MTEEEYKNATDAEKILYDCTGMLGENHPAIIEAMEKLANQRQGVVPHDTVVISIEPKYLIRAGIWYTNHKDHVDKLVKEKGFKYPPTDEYDVRNPNVWKPAHWKWFIQNYL